MEGKGMPEIGIRTMMFILPDTESPEKDKPET